MKSFDFLRLALRPEVLLLLEWSKEERESQKGKFKREIMFCARKIKEVVESRTSMASMTEERQKSSDLSLSLHRSHKIDSRSFSVFRIDPK